MSKTTFLMRLGAAILFLAAAFAAAPARADVLVLTHPDAMWSLRMDLPGFALKAPRISRDRIQVWAMTSNRQTGVMLTAFVNKETTLRKTSECRDAATKKLTEGNKNLSVNASEHGDFALAEESLREAPKGPSIPRLLHAFLYHDNFCIDVQLVKPPYSHDDRDLLLKSLDGLSTIAAPKEELARAAAYVTLSDPSEQVALDATQRLRAKDFRSADALLLPLCPESRRQAGDAAGAPECALRSALLTEANGKGQAAELGTMYWRSGDLLARSGRPDAALEAFRKSLDLRPDAPDTMYSIGRAQHDKHDLVAAGMSFNKALELRPNDARTMYAMVANLTDQGKLVDADSMVDRIEQTYPKESRVWYCRGEIMMKRGRYTEAIALFEKARDQGFNAEQAGAKIKECKTALTPPKKPKDRVEPIRLDGYPRAARIQA